MNPRWKRCQPSLVFRTGHWRTKSHLDYLTDCNKTGPKNRGELPVIFLASPRRPRISPSSPEVVGQPGAPAGSKEEEKEGARGGGGEVDEEGVEGRCHAPNLKKVDEDKEEMDAPYLVHLAHIASEQTKSKGGDGEDGAGNQGGL